MNPKSTGFRGLLTDVVTALCVLLLGVTASSAANATALPPSVVDLMQAHGIPENSISVVMRKVGTNQNTISHNATTPRNPASTMKLVTTAAALQLLGPQHRWRTHAFVRGKVRGNTLEGDLILRGSGDPWLVIERFWLLAQQLRGRGITHIQGDLLIDDTLFDRRTIEEKAIDGKSTRAYNTPPNALLVNFGATSLVVESDDDAVYVSADPPATTLQIHNTITPSNAACGGKGRSIRLDLKRSTSVTKLSVGGHYPVGCAASTFRRTLLPHGQYVYGVFKALWQQLGGTLAGGWHYGKTPARARVVAELESVPLAEVIRYINKFSNNVMARNLLLTLATDHPPSTPAKGGRVIENWLSQNGVAMPALHIDNGAGLSRKARISALGLAELLETATHWPWWPEFLGSLPIATVDGSLRKRFHNLAGPGRLRLKTGLLKDVRALAGYAIDRNGDIWVVVILHNHPQASSSVGIEVQHRLLETLFQ